MNQAVMDILSRTSGTSAGSPYDAMMQAAAAEAAAAWAAVVAEAAATLPDMLIEPTIDEQVELFAPLATTDWKKYWPLAAAAVGAIGVVMLMRRRKG